MNKVTIHLFYGVPCVGKSTAAIKYASENSLRTVIPTDYIREAQRVYSLPEENPVLFKVTHDAWELFGKSTKKNIIKGFTAHADSILPSLLAVTKKLARDGFDSVIEGVHFYSNIFERLSEIKGIEIAPTLMIVKDEQKLLKRIRDKEHMKARIGEPKDWRSNIKIIMTIQDFLIQDALKNNIQIIEI